MLVSANVYVVALNIIIFLGSWGIISIVSVVVPLWVTLQELLLTILLT